MRVSVFASMILMSLPAAASGFSSLLDFAVVPDSSGCHAPVDEARCNEFHALHDAGTFGAGGYPVVFTTVDGIRVDFDSGGVAGSPFRWSEALWAQGHYTTGSPLWARFSAPIGVVQIDLKLYPETDDIQWIDPTIYVEGYDADGVLIAREEAPAWVYRYTTLKLEAPPGTAFRSIRFAGGGSARVPALGEEVIEIPNHSQADNLRFRPAKSDGEIERWTIDFTDDFGEAVGSGTFTVDRSSLLTLCPENCQFPDGARYTPWLVIGAGVGFSAIVNGVAIPGDHFVWLNDPPYHRAGHIWYSRRGNGYALDAWFFGDDSIGCPYQFTMGIGEQPDGSYGGGWNLSHCDPVLRGQGAWHATQTTVPEPADGLLLLTGSMAMLTWRLRGRRTSVHRE